MRRRERRWRRAHAELKLQEATQLLAKLAARYRDGEAKEFVAHVYDAWVGTQLPWERKRRSHG